MGGTTPLGPDPAPLRIGELAKLTGVSVRSLRYYEAQGLLVPDRSPGGQRRYPAYAADRVIRIQELYAAGLNSRKIHDLLPCMRDEDGGPSALATELLVQDLLAERERLECRIRDIRRSQHVLDSVIEAARDMRSVAPGPTVDA